MDNKAAFASLVERDLKNKITAEEEKILESHLDQWRLCLLDFLKEVDNQITNNKIDFRFIFDTEEQIKDSAEWRGRALVFKRHVSQRIANIKHKIKVRNQNEQLARLSNEKNKMAELHTKIDALTKTTQILLANSEAIKHMIGIK